MRQTFNDSLQAREWEHKVLRRLDVIHNDQWLNKTTGKSIPPQFRKFRKKTYRRNIKKMSEARKKYYEKSPENRENARKIRQKVLKEKPDLCSGKNNGMFGKKHSEITRKKLSEKRKKRETKNSTRQLMSMNRKCKLWITNGQQTKMIHLAQWIDYEKDGWWRGRKL